MKFVDGLVAILRELGPVITAATPVLVIVVNWWVTKKQTKIINDHSSATTEDVKQTIAASTGQYKALPPDTKA